MRECCYSMTEMDFLGTAVIHSVWLIAVAGVLVEIILMRFQSARSRCSFATIAIILMPAFLGLACHGIEKSWLPLIPPIYQSGTLMTTWIAGLFVIGVTIQFGRLFIALACIAQLRRSSRASIPNSMSKSLVDLQNVRVRTVRAKAIAGPVTVGWLCPVILIPEHIIRELSPDQVALLIQHELAHVRSRDYLWNMLQRIAEAVVFYHPGVWLLGRRVRHEREFACDDLVVQSGVNTLDYSRALSSLEHLRSQWNPLFQPSNGAPLLSRIQRLLHGNSGRSLSVARMLFGLLTAAVGVSLTVVAAPAGSTLGERLASPELQPSSPTGWVAGTLCEPVPSPTAVTVKVYCCPE